MERYVLNVFAWIFFAIGAVVSVLLMYLGTVEVYNRARISNEIRPFIPQIVTDADAQRNADAYAEEYDSRFRR